MTRRPTAVIADDHQIVREGLKAALSEPGRVTEAGFEVVADCDNGMDAIVAVKVHGPDLAIIDVQMPLVSGVEAIIEIRRWRPDCKLIALTGVTSPGLLRQLINADVDGLFAKQGDIAGLYAGIPDILNGARVIEPQIQRLLARIEEDAPSLTGREQQTLNMIVRGLSNAEIGETLGISPKTVEKHRTSMMAKLEVSSVAQLLARALRDGLIDPAREL